MKNAYLNEIDDNYFNTKLDKRLLKVSGYIYILISIFCLSFFYNTQGGLFNDAFIIIGIISLIIWAYKAGHKDGYFIGHAVAQEKIFKK